jgi:hypothetical protein
MALSIEDEGVLSADDLRPITRVMYSSALIPGGESPASYFVHVNE